MKQTDQRIFTISSFSNAFLFLVLTLLWSWTLFLIAILRGEDVNIFPAFLLRILAGFGPLILALGMMKFRADGETLRSYWQRLTHWRQIPHWILISSLLITPLIALFACLTSQSSIPTVLSTANRWKINTDPITILFSWILPFFYGPLPEELGWRGYALPRLQSRWNPLFSSLFLGIVLALWYLPLFFIPSTYQFHLIFGSKSFWLFLLNVLSRSIILTALINAARGFLLPVIFFHYTTNLTDEILQLSTLVTAHWVFWTSCTASLIIIYWLLTKQVNFAHSQNT